MSEEEPMYPEDPNASKYFEVANCWQNWSAGMDNWDPVFCF